MAFLLQLPAWPRLDYESKTESLNLENTATSVKRNVLKKIASSLPEFNSRFAECMTVPVQNTTRSDRGLLDFHLINTALSLNRMTLIDCYSGFLKFNLVSREFKAA